MDALQQKIAARAEEIYEQQGRPEGAAEAIWRLAEREVLASLTDCDPDAEFPSTRPEMSDSSKAKSA